MRSLASEEIFSKPSSKRTSAALMSSIRSFRYSELKGSLPESMEYSMQPALHISTFEVYPPPVKISGAENATVPV